jgi:hypothetical protein
MWQKTRKIRGFWNKAWVLALVLLREEVKWRDAANLALAQGQSDDDTDNRRARISADRRASA